MVVKLQPIQKEMTILITGANGFAGSWMAKLFKDRKYTSKYFHKPVRVYMHTRADGDLTSPKETKHLLDKTRPDIILHCAGRVPKKGATITEQDYHIGNVVTFDNIVSASQKMNYKPHIILPGSAAVYPVQKFALQEATLADWDLNPKLVRSLTEKDQQDLSLMSPYGRSKAISEQVLQEYDSPWTVLRKPTILAPFDTRGNFAYEAAYHILNHTVFGEDERFPVANLGHIREYVCILDMFKAVSLTMTNPDSHNHIFNIGPTKPNSGFDVINIMRKLYNDTHRIKMPKFNLEKEFIYLNTAVATDSSKAKEILLYTPDHINKQVFQDVGQFTYSAGKTCLERTLALC